MGANTGISWTATVLPDGSVIPGATFNPWWGCFKVSDGCKHCYAESLSNRYGKSLWGPPATTRRQMMSDAYWRQPHTWNRKAEAEGVRKRVFCASMADVFEDHPDVVAARERLWSLIIATPALDWLLLTKRPENIPDMMPSQWMRVGLPANIWIGTSVEHQVAADERIPRLLRIPATIRFLSCEPLLSAIDLTKYLGGNLQSEYRRSSDLGADNSRCPVCGQRRSRMATSGTITGIGDFGSGDSMRTAQGGCWAISQRWLQTHTSDNREDEIYRTSAQNSVDGSQSEDDPNGLRNQPQGWDQGQQPSGQLGIGDALGKRDPFAARIGQLPEAQHSRSQVDTSTGFGNSAPLRPEGNGTCPNCGNVWHYNRNSEEYRQSQQVGMDRGGISWCIVGGESGPHHRPMRPEWARLLRDQCQAAAVPYFFKQVGGATSKSGGDLLDGRQYHEWPVMAMEGK